MSNYGMVCIDTFESGGLSQFCPVPGGASYREEYRYADVGVSIVPVPAALTGVTWCMKIDAGGATGAAGYGVAVAIGIADAALRGSDVIAMRGTVRFQNVANTIKFVSLFELAGGSDGTFKRRIEYDLNGGTTQVYFRLIDASNNAINSSLNWATNTWYDILWLSRASTGEDWLYVYNTGTATWDAAITSTTMDKYTAEGYRTNYNIGSFGKTKPTSGGVSWVARVGIQELDKSDYPEVIIGGVTNVYLKADGIGAHDDFPGTAADVDDIDPDNNTTFDSSATAGNEQAYTVVAADAGLPVVASPDSGKGILSCFAHAFIHTQTSSASGSLAATFKAGVRSNGGTDLYGATGTQFAEPSGGAIYWGGVFGPGWEVPPGLRDPDGSAWTKALVDGSQALLKLVSVSDATVTFKVTQAGLAYCVERLAGPAIPAGAIARRRYGAVI